MSASTPDDLLHKYLADAHAIEEQALVQLRRAPEISADPELGAVFDQHLRETESHERLVRERLDAHGAAPGAVKEAVMKAGGVGFALFAAVQPDSPGKLVTHAYAYEALEQAAYELLMRVADQAGDPDTVAAARRILGEEREMAGRLEGCFEHAATLSVAQDGGDPKKRVATYLSDAHALEGQSVELLARASTIAGGPELERLYETHLEQTRGHQELLAGRLDALGDSPSLLKDAAMRLGGLSWSLFFEAQPDTPGKLVAFSFALEHLEIAGYEQLGHVAWQAGDDETLTTVAGILEDEREMAGRLEAAFDDAAAASLATQGAAG
ncbi:MAG: ferritin-like domain-containing protein [Thermoleophilaceae bacterium]